MLCEAPVFTRPLIGSPARLRKGLHRTSLLQVSNIPSGGTGNAASCAEHAIFLALALLRDQHEMAASIRGRRVGVPLGQTLLGKSVLLIGYGNIAKELVPRCGS